MSSKKKRVTKQPMLGSPSGVQVEPAIAGQGTPITETKVTEREAAANCAEVIAKIETLRNSKVISFFAKDTVSMGADVCAPLYGQLRTIGKVERIDLFLNSTGGATEVPWRIVTLLRSFCNHLGVLIPRQALSAATHIALGANEIVMGDGSELSPVDPSRTHPLLPKDEQGRPLTISVQDLRHCIEFIRRGGAGTESESEAASPTVYQSGDLASIYTVLFQYVHPLALGAIEQSYALAKLITRKLLSTHIQDEKRVKEIADRLSDEFMSHHYLIGWKEARDDLGLQVTYDTSTLMNEMHSLYEIYAQQMELLRSLKPKKATLQEVMERPILWIDTTLKRHVLLEAFTLEAQKGGLSVEKILGARWAKVDIK